MAAVRLYVTLAVLLFATCFHTSEGWWRRRRRSSCSRVNCRWLSWSSWRSCNYYCSYGYGQCMTFPESAVRSIPSQCC
ncbi:hypothetical protein NP493_820g01014 [Ridgeia piscesae]|uniref:Secreted protein n=1 Tax=Ridgeia piscesae TaxID=27915 RepID=A0AAD9NMS0_RIDPI|nr:hypothetical protein NP493_820g01014 [Ridgeia piscesae]